MASFWVGHTTPSMGPRPNGAFYGLFALISIAF
jgi:hypothetical protein